MNCDMEEKGIVLRELSCRTAAELPAPELPDCCRSCPPPKPFGRYGASAAVRQFRRCTPGAEMPPKLSGCSGGCPLGAENPAAPAREAVRQRKGLYSQS
ncbi:unnamed protein product [Boreogadus saida]